MKKLLSILLPLTLVVALTGCGVPDGVSEEFHNRATSAFVEIDDDTMEMELSDVDDVKNFQLLIAQADTARETDFAESLEAMLKLQPKVVDQAEFDGESVAEYMNARKSAMKAMDLSETGGVNTVPVFNFTEDN
jgi:hypothetical protein